MKQHSLSCGPMDYIERPLKPSWSTVNPGDRDQAGSTDSGLSFSSRIDGEDPRYAKSSTGANDDDDFL